MLHFDANPITITWLQSYEECVHAKNNIKQRNWNTVFANISKPISPTSDSFLLIMSHICYTPIGNTLAHALSIFWVIMSI